MSSRFSVLERFISRFAGSHTPNRYSQLAPHETSAIAPYLDEVLPGPSFMPDNAKDRARMRMAIGIIDFYGYDALVGVAGYHLFPDFIGGK